MGTRCEQRKGSRVVPTHCTCVVSGRARVFPRTLAPKQNISVNVNNKPAVKLDGTLITIYVITHNYKLTTLIKYGSKGAEGSSQGSQRCS
jgi:hypothetical protein